jgi:hypothetical protein
LYKHSGQTHGLYDGRPYDGLVIMADSDVPYLCYVFAHLRICVAHGQQNNPENNENIEDTIQWQLFPKVLL